MSPNQRLRELVAWVERAASSPDTFRATLFTVLLVVSACAAAQGSFIAHHVRLLPGRGAIVETVLAVWCLCHAPLYLLARSHRQAVTAYTLYLFTSVSVVTLGLQSLPLGHFERINVQLPQNYTLICIALVLLPLARFVVFATTVTGATLLWTFLGEGAGGTGGAPVHLVNLALHATTLWIVSIVAATLIQTHYRRLIASRAELASHNERLEREVAAKAETIERHQARLYETQKLRAIGQLAGGMAHDLNSLLTVIKGYADLALAETEVRGELREDIEGIRRSADRAGALMGRLLAFSRRDVIQPRPLDLNLSIRGMVEVLERLGGRRVTLDVQLGEGLAPVLLDPTQLEQILLNLIANARDAMPGGGTARITTADVRLDEEGARRLPNASPGRYTVLTVGDTGCGMDETTRARLFEPFFTTKAGGQGAGLGLATLYGIITLAGGSIEVETAPGSGALFRIFLPVATRTEPAPEGEGGATPESRRALTVLVVDDEPEIRTLVGNILAAAGHLAVPATSGEDALRLAREYDGPIDIVLADVVLTGISGPDAAREIRALRPGVKALFMSSYADDAVARHGLTDPRAPFLAKPFGPRALLQKIREIAP